MAIKCIFEHKEKIYYNDAQFVRGIDLITYKVESLGSISTTCFIAKPSSGQLLCGTSNGIYEYYKSTNKWQLMIVDGQRSSGRINSFLLDKSGSVWYSNSVAVIRLCLSSDVFTTDNEYPCHEAKCLLEDKTGKLWIGGDKGLFHYNERQDRLFLSKGMDIIDIKNDSKNQIYFASNQGIFKLSELHPILIEGWGKLLQSGSPRCLLVDRKDALWCGTSTGIAVQANKNWHTVQFPDEITAVHCIHEDSQGNIWCGANTGLFVIEELVATPSEHWLEAKKNPSNRSQIDIRSPKPLTLPKEEWRPNSGREELGVEAQSRKAAEAFQKQNQRLEEEGKRSLHSLQSKCESLEAENKRLKKQLDNQQADSNYRIIELTQKVQKLEEALANYQQVFSNQAQEENVDKQEIPRTTLEKSLPMRTEDPCVFREEPINESLRVDNHELEKEPHPSPAYNPSDLEYLGTEEVYTLEPLPENHQRDLLSEKIQIAPRMDNAILKDYQMILTRYSDNSERRAQLDRYFSLRAGRVSVSNIQDVDGGGTPELREAERAQFYLTQNENFYFALPIPGMASMRSSYMEAMYEMQGNGSSISALSQAAVFEKLGIGSGWRLIEKGSITTN